MGACWQLCILLMYFTFSTKYGMIIKKIEVSKLHLVWLCTYFLFTGKVVVLVSSFLGEHINHNHILTNNSVCCFSRELHTCVNSYNT